MTDGPALPLSPVPGTPPTLYAQIRDRPTDLSTQLGRDVMAGIKVRVEPSWDGEGRRLRVAARGWGGAFVAYRPLAQGSWTLRPAIRGLCSVHHDGKQRRPLAPDFPAAGGLPSSVDSTL